MTLTHFVSAGLPISRIQGDLYDCELREGQRSTSVLDLHTPGIQKSGTKTQVL